MSHATRTRLRRSSAVLAGLIGLALPSVFGCSGGAGGALVRTDDGFRITESGSTRIGDRARFREATASLAADDLETAIAGFEASSEAIADRAAPRVNLAIALRHADRLEEAEQVLREAVEIHPRHVVAHNELGIVYRKLGRFDESRQSYERAITLFSDFHLAHRNLGILCDLFLEDAQCALEHYRRYLEIAPDDEQAAIWIADLEQRASQ